MKVPNTYTGNLVIELNYSYLNAALNDDTGKTSHTCCMLFMDQDSIADGRLHDNDGG